MNVSLKLSKVYHYFSKQSDFDKTGETIIENRLGAVSDHPEHLSNHIKLQRKYCM